MMQNRLYGCAMAMFLLTGSALAEDDAGKYEPGALHPFGLPNPAQTDPEARIFDSFIGDNVCTDERINFATKESTKLEGTTWTWYYDMNGYAIRDLYRYGTAAPASMRVYEQANKKWHVWYFVGQERFFAGKWTGGKQDDRLVFDQMAETQGRKILSRLEYFNITPTGFDWHSSNIDQESGEVFVDWRISCKKAF